MHSIHKGRKGGKGWYPLSLVTSANVVTYASSLSFVFLPNAVVSKKRNTEPIWLLVRPTTNLRGKTLSPSVCILVHFKALPEPAIRSSAGVVGGRRLERKHDPRTAHKMYINCVLALRVQKDGTILLETKASRRELLRAT